MPSKPFPILFLLPVLLLSAGSEAGAAPTQTPPTAAPAALTSDAASYCAAIRDPAAEARFAWQANALKGLEARLAETLKKLEERKGELQMLTDQRAAEVKQAEARMTDIFARMRPDAAALQLSAMDQGVAVAVLSKLPARAASAVLNEMEASRAAQLAEVMGGRRALSTTPPTGVQTR